MFEFCGGVGIGCLQAQEDFATFGGVHCSFKLIRKYQIRHSRAGGNPEGLFNMLLVFVLATQRNYFFGLDSRLRGNDG
jgi:hypothetical protein